MVKRASILLLVIASGGALPLAGEIIVPAGSAWRYLAEGSDQGTAWREPDFDDSGWATGAAPLGYGDPGLGTALPVPPIPRPITAYFRLTFDLDAAPTGETAFATALRRDDGAVVYLNWIEIHRDNMPSGPVSFDTLANLAVGASDETRFFGTAHLLTGIAREGHNVLAVEVHQDNTGSSDTVFDLSLERLDAPFSIFLPRPPVAVTFEHRERNTETGTGVIKRLDPAYTGWDYLRTGSYDPGLGAAGLSQPLARSLATGDFLPSSALCVSAYAGEIRTGPANLANARDVQVSLEILGELEPSFSQDDFIVVDLYVGDAEGPHRVPWLEFRWPDALSGEAAASYGMDAIVRPDGRFTRFTTPPGLVSDSATTVVASIRFRSASRESALYFDNLTLSGTAIEPEDYASFMRIRGSGNSVPPPEGDLDSDGLGNFLEYALGGDPFLAGRTPRPGCNLTPEGYAEFDYPRLPGFASGNAGRELQVHDVRYRAQFSPDGRTWLDGLGAPVFFALSATPSDASTVRLRTIFPVGREYPTGLFRLAVEPAPPVRETNPLADPFATSLGGE